MARDFFRMPKGVPREVARMVRTSTRKIPKAGQVLSYENAGILHDLLTIYRKTLTKESRAVVPKMERARTRETRRKHAEKVAEIRQQAEDTERAAAELERVEHEEVAFEFEIGIDYLESEGWVHPKGPKSDVSFNARLYRYDGAPLAETEAREAMAYFADTHRMPGEIGVRWVSWTGAGGGRERHGNERDLVNFGAILSSVSTQAMYAKAYRMGSVKRDRL